MGKMTGQQSDVSGKRLAQCLTTTSKHDTASSPDPSKKELTMSIASFHFSNHRQPQFICLPGFRCALFLFVSCFNVINHFLATM